MARNWEMRSASSRCPIRQIAKQIIALEIDVPKLEANIAIQEREMNALIGRF
jgi:hypothetical protein